jgi:glycosyltransferase involved in cell wall biosynthesis
LIKNIIFFPKSVYLAKWLEENQVTHLHAYWATYPASVALVCSEMTGIPFSFTGHAHDIYLNLTQLKEKMLRSTFISTCTRLNKEHLQKVAPEVSPEKILVNYHGLDLEKFSVNGKKRGDPFQILSVGTLHYYKGFNYLLDALRRIKLKGLRFRATIVGGGPLEFDLRRHIRMLELEGEVKMTGPLKQAQVISYYKESDLFILMAQPEWHWGIPNVLIEALAAKTPVITTRFGSVEELVREGETGLFVSSKDSRQLAEAVEKLYHDDGFRKSLAEAGHRMVQEHFDLKENIRILSEKWGVYEDCAALCG